MKNTFRALIFLALAPTALLAQADQSHTSRQIGIGVRTSIFQRSDFDLSDIPPNRILINFDPIDNLRLDVQFGSYTGKDDQGAGSSGLKANDEHFVYGLGVHYLKKLDQVKFTAGLRYLLGDFKDEFLYTNNSGLKAIGKNREKTSSVALVFGGEYFLAKWFSVGAEFSLLHTELDGTPDSNSYEDDYTLTSTQTESSILFRFYPF
jgi:hypothetical protein